jgi:hypothetical protein
MGPKSEYVNDHGEESLMAFARIGIDRASVPLEGEPMFRTIRVDQGSRIPLLNPLALLDSNYETDKPYLGKGE